MKLQKILGVGTALAVLMTAPAFTARFAASPGSNNLVIPFMASASVG